LGIVEDADVLLQIWLLVLTCFAFGLIFSIWFMHG